MEARILITLDEAIELVDKEHQWDARKHGRSVYCKRTFYNFINKGLLKRYGPRHIAQLDRDEVILKLCR